MKKKLVAANTVLAICLALLLAFAIYITLNEPVEAPQTTPPEVQNTTGDTQAPSEEDLTGESKDETGSAAQTDAPTMTTKPDAAGETQTAPAETGETVTVTTLPEETAGDVTQPQETVTETTQPRETTPVDTEPATEQTEVTGGTGADGALGENELPPEPFE